MTGKGVEIDYQGARGSNTGDEFHELWASRQAMRLLDSNSHLAALKVEGVKSEIQGEAWNGVDCTLYFGGDSNTTATRVSIQQLKYSAANPSAPWTTARLATGKNGKPASSLIRKLANAYSALIAERSGKPSDSIDLTLVSNQPIDPSLIKVLEAAKISVPREYKRAWKSGSPDLHRLVHASGLTPTQFEKFAKVLDLQGATGSRFAMEDGLLQTMSQWADTEFVEAASGLRGYVRKRMLPESGADLITRETLLLHFGVSNDSLYPCPSKIKRISNPVRRAAADDISARMKSGKQRLCVSGGAGVGKTTLLQEVEPQLPEGSEMIVFDCYGSGAYLDASAYRHQPVDAFRQLANDVASRLRLPLLISNRSDGNYAKAFHRRLTIAAEALQGAKPAALLVVAVDAADNSITAAQTREPPEASFVHELVSFEELPPNVRILISARTARVPSLKLPASFESIDLPSFTSPETAANVRRQWNAPDEWVDDFHNLSGGVPRVQAYAFDSAPGSPHNAIEALRPSGKALDQVFRERFEEALKKAGRPAELKKVCAGLIALPRPIPMGELAAVLEMAEDQVSEICSDLSPGVRTTDNQVSFADEDFESFVRDAGRSEYPAIVKRTAERLLGRYKTDSYAALNVAAALMAASDRKSLLKLAEDEPEPDAATVLDPVVRQEIRLRRLRLATYVCREAGDPALALRFVLIGAEAKRTESATLELLKAFPALATRFAPETVRRQVLGDADSIRDHGPILIHLMAEDARQGDAVAVREGRRRLHAWSRARQDDYEAQTGRDRNAWEVTDDCGGAALYAEALLGGARETMLRLSRFRPLQFALGSSKNLIDRLVAENRWQVLEGLAVEAKPEHAAFVYVALAMCGQQIDLPRLANGAEALKQKYKIGPPTLRESYRESSLSSYAVDIYLSGVELMAGREDLRSGIAKLIESFLTEDVRQISKRHDHEVPLLDAILRSYCLRELLAGREPKADGVLTARAPPPENESRENKRLHRELTQHDERLQGTISTIFPVYLARARALIAGSGGTNHKSNLEAAQQRFQGESWKFDRGTTSSAFRARMSENLLLLSAVGIPADDVMTLALGFHRGRWPTEGSGIRTLFERLAGHPKLHDRLLKELVAASDTVRKERSGAEDKSRTLSAYAELLSSFSPDDAAQVFRQAVSVASELDLEVMDQLRFLDQLIERAANALGSERIDRASELSEILHDAAIRLSNVDYFPWAESFSGLARLDVSTAFACASRWSDDHSVWLGNSLPATLSIALRTGEITSAQAIALLGLIDRNREQALEDAIAAIDPLDSDKANKMADELAQDVLTDRLSGLTSIDRLIDRYQAGAWSKRLVERSAFEADLPAKGKSSSEAVSHVQARPTLEALAWPPAALVSGVELHKTANEALQACRDAGEILALRDVLFQSQPHVAVGKRREHLDALVAAHDLQREPQFLEAILQAGQTWATTPAVAAWCREKLPQLVANEIEEFARYLPWEKQRLAPALKMAGLTDEEAQRTLLHGIEKNVENLSSGVTFVLAGEVAAKLQPEHAKSLCTWYLQRLLGRVAPDDRERVPADQRPATPSEAIARILYAHLGDVDLRIRWRAGHILRRLARLGEEETVRTVVDQYDRRADPAFRDPKAPYYWLASRLWLVIALDRMAQETPASIAKAGPLLLGIALSKEFPHLLIRSFAADACKKLVTVGLLQPTTADATLLDAVNISSLPPGEKGERYGRSFDQFDRDNEETRRFRFDGLDTLRYWYDPWLRAFDGLEPNDFLVAAEYWIVDKWEVPASASDRLEEPRRGRFSERNWSLSGTSHGALPTLERYHTHLEWHAMWCAAGKLLETHRVRPPEYGDDDPDGIAYQVSREKLTEPPLWLADLVGPRPLLPLHWIEPTDTGPAWLEHVSDAEFQIEMFPDDRPGYVVVDSHFELKWGRLERDTRVSTGLVSPETGHALVRALQTVENAFDYYICPEGHDLEIDETEYKLLGWLQDSTGDSRFDDKDVYRNGVRRISMCPGQRVSTRLGLARNLEPQVIWTRPGQNEPIFIYEAWGDRELDDERARYRETFTSSGHRLLMRKTDLAEFLEAEEMDLIAEVEVRKHDRGERYYSYDTEGASENDFDRVFLLRRDGAIQAAERSFGAWRSSGPRAGAPSER